MSSNCAFAYTMQWLCVKSKMETIQNLSNYMNKMMPKKHNATKDKAYSKIIEEDKKLKTINKNWISIAIKLTD